MKFRQPIKVENSVAMVTNIVPTSKMPPTGVRLEIKVPTHNVAEVGANNTHSTIPSTRIGIP